VSKIDRSRHIGKRRAGKSDPIDAVRAALAAVLVTAPAPLGERIRPLPRERRAKECAALTRPAGIDRQTRALHQTLIRLGQRIGALAEEAAGLETQIAEIVEDMAPGLVAAEPGLGALSAAQILLSWSHAGRICGPARWRIPRSADSLGGTSTTCSPSAISQFARCLPMPWHPSIAQVRSGQRRTARSIARYPEGLVSYRPPPSTASSPAMTSIVADRLCGSIPITTAFIASSRPLRQ
jgi:hypothetical protein